MEVQINPNCSDKTLVFTNDDGTAIGMATPAINEDYWWLRVAVSDSQAIIAFPKFGTLGVGFQIEDDWNTNCPYTYSPAYILGHIRRNKGDDAISDEDCIQAITLLQETIARLWKGHDQEKVKRARAREEELT